jgi:predicted RNA polymerase sigma factor
VYPSSALAYQVRAELAERREEMQQAVESYRRAIELLTTKQDQLYISRARDQEVSSIIQRLRTKIESLLR